MGKHRWKGELAKPIRPKVIRPQGLAVTDAETVARANEEMENLYRQAIEETRVEKLRLLMDHYGISDKADFLVSRSHSQSTTFPDLGLILRRSDKSKSATALRSWSRTTGQAAGSSGHRNGLTAF